MDAKEIKLSFQLSPCIFPVSFLLSTWVSPAADKSQSALHVPLYSRNSTTNEEERPQRHPVRPLSVQQRELWVPGEIRSLNV